MSRSPHPPTRILKIMSLSGFRHIFSPDELKNTLLSQGYVLQTATSMGIVGGTHVSRTGGSSDCLGPADRSTCGHILSVNSFNRYLEGTSKK